MAIHVWYGQFGGRSTARKGEQATTLMESWSLTTGAAYNRYSNPRLD
jgi:hypothetical protein